jgi:methionine synthase II (cobalamin-independent)
MITAHADVVGSLLRPPWLLETQERLRAGQIARPAYIEPFDDHGIATKDII